MITGIPKTMPYEKANIRFKEAMNKMFTPSKIANAKVVGNFNNLFNMC
jgi:hypothetical protein